MTCKARTKRGRPENFGSEPKCAFPNGAFTSENWNCATLIELRGTSNSTIYGDDETLEVIPLYENTFNFMIIGYYKQRGTVHTLMVIKEGSIIVPSMVEVEAVIKSLRK